MEADEVGQFIGHGLGQRVSAERDSSKVKRRRDRAEGGRQGRRRIDEDGKGGRRRRGRGLGDDLLGFEGCLGLLGTSTDVPKVLGACHDRPQRRQEEETKE